MFLLHFLNFLSFFLEIHQWVTVTLYLEPPYIQACRLCVYCTMSDISEVSGYCHLQSVMRQMTEQMYSVYEQVLKKICCICGVIEVFCD
jgi:hypothetical protein